MNRGPHSLHECRSGEEFSRRFAEATGQTVDEVIDEVVASGAPRAVFVVGSIALGMGSSGSDLDLIVLVDDAQALAVSDRIANDRRELQFSNGSDLLAGIFLTVRGGIMVDRSVVFTPEIHRVYQRLRSRGPELSETEIRILGRLSSGWLLSQTDGYVERNCGFLSDRSLDVYCCTMHYVAALHEVSKAKRALAGDDIPLALQHGRCGVESAYLAYFASEGLLYLGTKWLAQLGLARGSAERLARHPVLKQGLPLLFPGYPSDSARATEYLGQVRELVTALRALIEQKLLFRIAFQACPQIHAL